MRYTAYNLDGQGVEQDQVVEMENEGRREKPEPVLLGGGSRAPRMQMPERG